MGSLGDSNTFLLPEMSHWEFCSFTDPMMGANFFLDASGHSMQVTSLIPEGHEDVSAGFAVVP